MPAVPLPFLTAWRAASSMRSNSIGSLGRPAAQSWVAFSNWTPAPRPTSGVRLMVRSAGQELTRQAPYVDRVFSEDDLQADQFQEVVGWLSVASLLGLLSLLVVYLVEPNWQIALMLGETGLFGAAAAWIRFGQTRMPRPAAVITITTGMWTIAVSTGLLFPMTSPVVVLMNAISVAIAFTSSPKNVAVPIGIVAALLSGGVVALEFFERPFDVVETPKAIQATVLAVFAVVDSGLVFVIFSQFVRRLSLAGEQRARDEQRCDHATSPTVSVSSSARSPPGGQIRRSSGPAGTR